MKSKRILLSLALISTALSAAAIHSAAAQDDIVAKAKAFVKEAAVKANKWTGPTSGPKAASGKSVIYVSSDQRNGGAQGVGDGVAEAAKAIGWGFKLLDGRGTVQGHGDALGQAIVQKPSAIVLGGFDATEQADLVEQANKAGIVVVGWHAAGTPGPQTKPAMFTNVTTPAKDTSEAAAYLAIANSNGRAGVVIFTDSAYAIAIAKSDAMASIIRQCKTCTLLETRVQSLGTVTKDMPTVTANLLQKYGRKWTYSLGINDLYFDGMVPALSSANIRPSGQLYNISAGDGSESAYQRIRTKQYQYATIPEPINLQGWQLIDEINRAIAGEKESGFKIPVHIVVPTNVNFDGGQKNLFDPENGYRDQYKKIWAK
jgi:ribose transport system substrate-binding protein